MLKGDLAKDYDLILVPSQRNSKTLVFDIPKADKPLAYQKSAKFKFLGDYGSTDDISGGMGGVGVAEFQKYVDEGGLLITLGTSSAFPSDYGLASTIETSSTGAKFYAPGPIVDADIVEPEHPVFYGYTAKTVPVRYANGPLLSLTTEMDKNNVLMRFPGRRETRAERSVQWCGRHQEQSRDCGSPGGQRGDRDVHDQPCMALAERWRVPHDLQLPDELSKSRSGSSGHFGTVAQGCRRGAIGRERQTALASALPASAKSAVKLHNRERFVLLRRNQV